VILPTEYAWIESYLDNDSLWLNDSLNWEEAFTLVFNEVTLYSFLTTPFFINNYFFVDFFTKISLLDIFFLLETDKSNFPKEFFDLFIWDISNFIHVKFLPTDIFFYSDYQDLMPLLLYYSPELIFAVNELINTTFIQSVMYYTPSIVYDIFQDSLNNSLSEVGEHFLLFFIFFWVVLFIVNIFRLIKWNRSIEIYFIKFYVYLHNLTKEFRIQFEALIQTFFFFFFFWTMEIATFDDDKEELIEFFNVNCFFFFNILILYLLFKYSQHYFAFLEASVTDGKSVSFILKQFSRDFINSFALFLRFFILLFRLNVYDTLDDFYDSYYIFIGDFDDDEYYFELLFFYHSLLMFSFDNNDDGLYSLEDENTFFFNLFYLYFVCWAKFFTFLFFILEEILRLSLAFYICYLITFEVHAVNFSYLEDTYFYDTRAKLKNFFRLKEKTLFYEFK